MSSSIDEYTPEQDRQSFAELEANRPNFRPHAAVSVFTVVDLNTKTGLIDYWCAKVYQHTDLSLCPMACYTGDKLLNPSNRNPFLFEVSKKGMDAAGPIFFTQRERSEMVRDHESGEGRTAAEKLVRHCHLSNIGRVLKSIQGPQSGSEGYSECRCSLSRHPTALVSFIPSMDLTSEGYYNSTFGSVYDRPRHIQKLQSDKVDTIRFGIHEAPAPPLRTVANSFEGTPTAWTRERQSPSTLQNDPSIAELTSCLDEQFYQYMKQLTNT